MSRNRMKNSQSLHWMGVVKWVLIAGLLSVLGLSYMLCKNQNLHLAEETLHLEKQLNGIQKRNAQLTYDLERMKSPVPLEHRLAQMRSTLVHIGDSGLLVEHMEQSVRARLARIGTIPQGTINYNTSAVAAAAAPAQAPAQ
jgi:hypothetical protein